MSMNNPLSNVLSHITNYDSAGKRTMSTSYCSKIVKKVLDLLKDEGYIGEYKETKDSKGNSLQINLLGNINKTGAIRPEFQISATRIEYFEKRYLPARGFGIIIMSTNRGMMTHIKAKELGIGGKLLAYCY